MNEDGSDSLNRLTRTIIIFYSIHFFKKLKNDNDINYVLLSAKLTFLLNFTNILP